MNLLRLIMIIVLRYVISIFIIYIVFDNEMANEDITKEESISRVVSRENSMNQSKACLFNFRSKPRAKLKNGIILAL